MGWLGWPANKTIQLQADAGPNKRKLMTVPKVPNSYLSICRGPIRDSHGPLFLAVTRPPPAFLSLGRGGNVGFPGLEGTIRGAVGAPRCAFETGSSYELL